MLIVDIGPKMDHDQFDTKISPTIQEIKNKHSGCWDTEVCSGSKSEKGTAGRHFWILLRSEMVCISDWL